MQRKVNSKIQNYSAKNIGKTGHGKFEVVYFFSRLQNELITGCGWFCFYRISAEYVDSVSLHLAGAISVFDIFHKYLDKALQTPRLASTQKLSYRRCKKNKINLNLII